VADDGFVSDVTALRGLASRLETIATGLETHDRDPEIPDFGHHDLSDAFVDFIRGWRDGRRRIITGVRAARCIVRDAAHMYETSDREHAARLRASGPADPSVTVAASPTSGAAQSAPGREPAVMKADERPVAPVPDVGGRWSPAEPGSPAVPPVPTPPTEVDAPADSLTDPDVPADPGSPAGGEPDSAAHGGADRDEPLQPESGEPPATPPAAGDRGPGVGHEPDALVEGGQDAPVGAAAIPPEDETGPQTTIPGYDGRPGTTSSPTDGRRAPGPRGVDAGAAAAAAVAAAAATAAAKSRSRRQARDRASAPDETDGQRPR
jgi:hypothetical protein